MLGFYPLASRPLGAFRRASVASGTTQALTGGGAMLFAEAAALAAARGVTSSRSAAFAESSALARRRGAVASAAALGAQASALAARRGVAGSGAAQFAESAAVRITRGFASANAGAFAGSGAISLRQGFAAAAAQQFAEAATLTRKAGLTSARSFTFTATAAWGASLVALTGSGRFGFAAQALLSRRAGASASVAAVFAASAALAKAMRLAGTGTSLFGASSSLAAARAMTSSVAFGSGATALMARERGLSATAESAFGTASALLIDRGLTALGDAHWLADAVQTGGHDGVALTYQARVLQALKALAAAALPGATVGGFDADAAKAVRRGALASAIGRPGIDDEADFEFSGPVYAFRQRVDLDLVAPAGAGASELDDMIAAIGAAVDADRTLGGLCDWVEATAPRRGNRSFGTQRFGIAAAVNWATVAITAEYHIGNPLGQ